jgi:dethiobiotin synthetase
VPDRTVVVVGTGTEVGKTWVACQVAAALAGRGWRVAARKPAQSFAPGEAGDTDAHRLAATTGERPEDVCPAHRWYPVPFAPPMAAAALGRPGFTVADLVAELRLPAAGVDVALVETAGGVRSPIADDGDNVDLVAALGPDLVLLVADAGLGTISAVRSAMDALTAKAPGHATVVVLNRFDAADELHRRNADWLSGRDGDVVATSPATVIDIVGAVVGDAAGEVAGTSDRRTGSPN